jgi:hypothetical protein
VNNNPEGDLPVINLKKFVMCLGLLAVCALPLSACSGTWDGMKEDWHDMTGSNDQSGQNDRTAGQTAAPAQAPADSSAPSAYN